MNCIKCNSPRIIKFLDGFGEHRIFCKTCHESIPIMEFEQVSHMRKLWEFTQYQDTQSIKIGGSSRW